MGQVLSHSYKKIVRAISEASSYQRTMIALKKLNEHSVASHELQDFQMNIISAQERDKLYLESFFSTMNNPKLNLQLRCENELKNLRENFKLKEALLKTFVTRRGDFDETITEQYLIDLQETIADYMVQNVVKNILVTLKSFKYLNGYASINALEDILYDDYPLEDLQDDWPLWKAEFTGWYQSEKDESLKTAAKNLFNCLDKQLKNYISQYVKEAAAAATPTHYLYRQAL